jgi:quercetin dioxygenase-like cupin family protein
VRVIKKSSVEDENRNGYSVKSLVTYPINSHLENIGFYLTKIPVGGKVACHYHPKALEILIFLTEGLLKSEKKQLLMQEGDIAILKPGEFHEITGRQETKLIAIRMPNYKTDKVLV